MSGGHFSGTQYHIGEIARDIEEEIRDNKSNELDVFGNPRGRQYSRKVIKAMKYAVRLLREADIFVNRIDYLLSGDHGEESFLQRLKEDLRGLK